MRVYVRACVRACVLVFVRFFSCSLVRLLGFYSAFRVVVVFVSTNTPQTVTMMMLRRAATRVASKAFQVCLFPCLPTKVTLGFSCGWWACLQQLTWYPIEKWTHKQTMVLLPRDWCVAPHLIDVFRPFLSINIHPTHNQPTNQRRPPVPVNATQARCPTCWPVRSLTAVATPRWRWT